MSNSEGNVATQEGQGVEASQPQPEQERTGYFGMMKGFMFRALIIYFIASYFRKPAEPVTNPAGSAGKPITRIPAINVFSDGTIMDLYVYLSEQEKFSFSHNIKPSWIKRSLVYGDWVGGANKNGNYQEDITFPASQNLQNNGSIYIHTYLVRSGFSPDPRAEGKHVAGTTMHASHCLNKYRKRKFHQTSNLITGHTERTTEEIEKSRSMSEEIISYWHPNITISVVHDFTQWVPGTVPSPLDQYVEFSPAGDSYKPVLFLNTYWNLNKEHFPINSTISSLNLTMIFQPLSLFKWQMYAAQSMKNKYAGAAMFMAGEEDDADQDTVKEMFLETSPYLLALTAIISLLHSVFEMLAFKNDVQFWNNRKSLEGLSVRSVFFNVYQSLIVLLYVMDNETNFVIKLSCFVGLGIEIWKITKVTDITVNWDSRIFGVPTISVQDKGTYAHSNTKKFDKIAFRYLGMAFFPLMACYFFYSLVYDEHKGWYSFILSINYGFLLTFGFIMMTPQLFINYKMKSVAHLPWRMLTYKALNTFIDDVFAFVIKMPTMYRIGCLRDDLIFFIFLYQRYIYPIDPSRMNEFGFSQEMSENSNKKIDTSNAEGSIEGAEAAAIEGDEPAKPVEDKKND